MIISDNCSKCTLYGQYSICPFSVKVWEDQMYISGRNCLPCLKKTQICYALILFLHLTLRTLNWRCAGFQVWSVWEGFLFVLQEASDFVHMHMQQMADKLNENIAVSCWYYVNLFVCLFAYVFNTVDWFDYINLNYELRITNYELRITNYELWILRIWLLLW